MHGIGKKGSLKKRGNIGYLYVAPWVIGMLVFQLYPFVVSLFYSFTDYSMGSDFKWVGLDNYVRMFTRDRDYWNTLFATFRYVFMAVPMKIIAALIVALLLNMKLRGMSFYRTAYYLPSIMGGSVAVSLLWRSLFEYNGVVNRLLGIFGIGPIGWLSDPDVALTTISLLSVWQFGSSMIYFLAGLKQIPQDLYEAARVDGAGTVRIFFKITLPMLTPIVFFNLVMQMINAFQEFTSAFVVTNGGPAKSTYLYGLMLYQNGFMHFRMGYASALSWVLFIIILIFTLLVFRSSSYWTFYSDGGDNF